jgi:hypothetical protein
MSADVSKCTKGPYSYHQFNNGSGPRANGAVYDNRGKAVASLVNVDNGPLIAEAFNVAAETGLSPKQLQGLLQDILDCRPEEGQTEYDGKMERECPYCGILEWGKPHEDGCPFITARDALAKIEKGK